MPTSAPCSQVRYTRPGTAGSAARRTWNTSRPRTLVGFDRVLPPSVEVTIQAAFGTWPAPRRVTNDTYRVPSASNAASGA